MQAKVAPINVIHHQEEKPFSVKLVWATPNAEKMVLYTARVSSNDRESENTKLLGYLIRNKHWSPLEMANLCLEITASRAIIRQILRHRSFSFQEFSQRYQSLSEDNLIVNPARRQDTKNRQNSIDDISPEVQKEWEEKQRILNEKALETYQWALSNNIAKECARAVLPEGNTISTLCMNGTLRSWVHYLELRIYNGTQKEHQDVAKECLRIFKEQFPIISEAAFSSSHL